MTHRLIAAKRSTPSCSLSSNPLLAAATERSSLSRIRADHNTEASCPAPLTATPASTAHRHSTLSLHLCTPLTLAAIISTKDERFVSLLLGRRKPHHLRLISLPCILRLRESAGLSNLVVTGYFCLLYLLLGLSSTLHHSIHSWLCSWLTACFPALLRKQSRLINSLP